MINENHKILFEPIKIGSLEIKNRFALAPMGAGGLCDADGTYNARAAEFYAGRAKGGAGLLITGVTMIENEIEKCNMPSLPCPTINPSNFVKTGKVMTERVHAYGTKMFLQLSAGFGRVGIPTLLGTTAVAPSPIPHRWLPGVTCRELAVDEIKTYVKRFAESAVIAKNAGFDGIEVHAVHEGYLLDQFAISFFNKRTDEYGGSLYNRLRFTIEIVQAVKEACGQDFPVSLRYSLKSFLKDWKDGGLPGEDFIEKGRDIEEGIEAAKILEEAGYDAFDGDVGSYESWYWAHPPMYQEKGLYLPYNAILKQALKVPVITAGRMENPELASQSIVEGKTDIIGLARPLLADPEIPNKILAGRFDKVRPCLSCQEECMGRLAAYSQTSCAVNPACGRENEYGIKKADQVKTVMIVGGGVAGMEAARVCAIRGYKVTLFEKADHLGGNLIPSGVPDFKEDDLALAKWFENELKELDVDVRYNAGVSKEDIKNFGADVVIIATGSIPKMLKIDDANNVFAAAEVLLGRKEAGKATMIIGGGLVGCETAIWLADQGKKVTIVEALDDILKVGGPLCHANGDMLRGLIKLKGIDVRVNTTVQKAEGKGFVVKTDGKEYVVEADTAIVAIGYTSNGSLYDEIKFDVPKAYRLGDASRVQNIMYAIWDAYEVARNI